MRKKILFLMALMAVLVSCTDTGKTYKIAVSQCSEDIWRNKLNDELKMDRADQQVCQRRHRPLDCGTQPNSYCIASYRQGFRPGHPRYCVRPQDEL